MYMHLQIFTYTLYTGKYYPSYLYGVYRELINSDEYMFQEMIHIFMFSFCLPWI